MSEDELLTALAKAAKEDEIEEDPRWAALVEGRLSEADRKALEELAAGDARHEEALALLTPLGEGAKERIGERILGEMARAPAGAEVIALKPKRRWIPAAAALALAAAVALLVTLRREAPPEVAQNDPIPSYELSLAGGELRQRALTAQADAHTEIVLGLGSSLELTLRPATPVHGPVAVRAFLIEDGQARPWDVRAEISEEGAVHVAGERQALFPAEITGPVEIAIAVGRPGALPDAEAAVRGAPGAGVQVFRRQLVLADAHP